MAASATSSSKGSLSAPSTGADTGSRASLKGGAAPVSAGAVRASLLKGGPAAPAADAPPEPPPGPTPEELEAARIAAEEAARLELKAAPIREYLETTVVPLLLKGMQILAVERPENPVDYLAQYLILKNPQPLPPTMEEEVEEVMDEIPWLDLEADLLPPAAPPATRAASVRPALADAQAPAAATRAASVKPVPTDPPPPATRAPSVKPAAAPPPAAAMKPAAATRAASVKPTGDAPAAAAAATRAASVKPAADAVLGAAASRAASIKPAAPAPAAATRAGSVKPAAA